MTSKPDTGSTTLQSPRTTVKRLAKRARYDFDAVAAILDEGICAHVGFAVDGQPYVIPTGYGRKGRDLFVHGSAGNRMLKALAEGAPCCVTVTHIDGLVLARSGFHSSVNYRSAVVLGIAVEVTGNEAKREALRVITEHIVPGRWDDSRAPTDKELQATRVLRIPIVEASAKVRTGPPVDDEEDYALPYWAGVMPLRVQAGEPVADPRLGSGRPVPAYVAGYARPPMTLRTE